MKLFQKTYPLVGIMLLLSGGSYLYGGFFFDEDAKDEELERITSAHTRVFSKNNLFAKKNDETDYWYGLLNSLKGYVDKNAGGDKTLLEAFAICVQVSNNVINTLKIVYNSIFAGKRWPSQATIATARSNLGKLAVMKDLYLVRASKKLEGTSYFWQKKKGVKEVLLRLMLTLDITIDKLANDFKKQVIALEW